MITNGPIEYLTRFSEHNLNDFQYAMIEFKPQKGYGNFPNENKILQCMVDLTWNLRDKLLDIRIPETFESDKVLLEYVNNFKKYIESLDPIFQETIETFNDFESIPLPVVEINSRRKKVYNVINEFLERVETIEKKQNREGEKTNEEGINIEDIKKITIGQLLIFIKKLSIGSVVLILSIITSLIIGTYKITHFIDSYNTNNSSNISISAMLDKMNELEQTNNVLILENERLKNEKDTLIINQNTTDENENNQ